jgi:hypothetical protein
MKGRDYARAVEQLETTLSALQHHLLERLPPSARGRTRFVAVIVSDRPSPAGPLATGAMKADIQRFQQKFKSRLHVIKGVRVSGEREGASADLTPLL